jgi:Ser/Thr protein kinase RdoA (MazF antagonist)
MADTGALPQSVVAAIAERFALGAVSSCTPVTEGLMNPNWRVRSAAGVFAVKQLRDATPDAVRRQHELLPRLAGRGIPVPAVRAARGGDSLADIDGHWYAVSGWLAGTHRTGRQLGLPACRALGALLGRIHTCLRDLLPVAAPTLLDKPTAVVDAVANLDRFAMAATAGDDAFDRLALAEIAWRRDLLTRVAAQRPAEQWVQPVGWTHGDLNHLNLLFTRQAVSGVLDWDRLDIRPYGLEVVRSATLLFATDDARGADLQRIAAFVAGYRRHVTITDDELRDAAHRRWWTVVCESWVLRMHYAQNNRLCDHLLAGSGNLLRWWTGNRQAVDAALTAARSPIP